MHCDSAFSYLVKSWHFGDTCFSQGSDNLLLFTSCLHCQYLYNIVLNHWSVTSTFTYSVLSICYNTMLSQLMSTHDIHYCSGKKKILLHKIPCFFWRYPRLNLNNIHVGQLCFFGSLLCQYTIYYIYVWFNVLFPLNSKQQSEMTIWHH